MNRKDWQQIDELFTEAAGKSPSERAVFLEQSCAGDSKLRREVERLLKSNDTAPEFIETPAFEIVASEIAGDQSDALIGTALGRYTVLKLIGLGGMGQVYLAEDRALGRKVALKILLDSYAEKDPDGVRRFQQEARAASTLNHPNIAHIYEIDRTNGTNFIAMEYVEGELLESRISGQPMGPLEIIDIAIQIADTLDEAHAKGITHRDIKSANVIISDRGRIKVLDFGLAKTSSLLEDGSTDSSFIKTRPGLVFGTVSYMSPEQALGRKVDNRTDIFSLGVVLYEMATGRLPFNGDTPTETIDRIAHAQPDGIARFNYDVPDELERIIRKSLRKSPDERYQTARDLLVDLKNLRHEMSTVNAGLTYDSDSLITTSKDRTVSKGLTRDVPAHPTSSAEYIVGEIKRHKLAAGLVAGLLVIALIAIPIALRKLGTGTVAPSGSAMKSKRLITSATGGKAGNTAISPDGRFVVYKDDAADRRQALWIKQVATGATKQIVDADEVQYRGTTFSHDGNFVYYVVKSAAKYPSGALFQVPVIGGRSKQLMVNISGPITESPDGKQISFQYENHVMVADANGVALREVATVFGTRATTPVGPAWSPNGELIAFGSQAENGPYMSIFTVNLKSGKIDQVTKQKWGSVRRLLWLTDGSGLIALASDPEQSFSQIWEISYPAGQVRGITSDVNGHGHVSLGLTADSSTLVTQQEDDVSHVWISDYPEVHATRQITAGEGKTDGVFGLSWLAGNLLYSSRTNRGWNLWQVKADGTEPSALTSDAYRDEYPVATPDGQKVVFRSTRAAGLYHIWTMRADGTDLKQLTTGDDTEETAPRVSPDGRSVVYFSRTAGKLRVRRVSIDGGDPIQLTDYQSYAPDISPDGKFIACGFFDESTNPARWRVGIISFSGGRPVKTFDLPDTSDFRQSPLDGRAAPYVRWVSSDAIAYVDRRNGASNIWSQSIDGGLPKQLTNFSSGLIFNFDFSRDGKHIATARGTRSSDVILISGFR